jgi:hypothetical protein
VPRDTGAEEIRAGGDQGRHDVKAGAQLPGEIAVFKKDRKFREKVQ